MALWGCCLLSFSTGLWGGHLYIFCEIVPITDGFILQGAEELSPAVEGPSCVHLQDPAQLRRITQAVTTTK